MKKKLLAFVGLLFLVTPHFSYAATDWYSVNKIGMRTIYVKFEQPVSSVAVHYVGRKSGKCTPPYANVKVMEFVPASTVKTDSSLIAALSLKKNGQTGQFSASNSSSATAALPAVFKYSFFDFTLSQLHYNILYYRNGKPYSLGWRPDSGGGCTYK